MSPAIRADYREAGHEIVSSCEGGGTLLMYPVTSNTQASSYAAETVSFPTYDPIGENEDQFKVGLDEAGKNAASDMNKVMSFRDDSKGTDLLWACQKAADYFNGERFRGAREKDLFLLTDGLQQSPELDVTAIDLTPARIKETVTRLKADGYLPDLRSVTVWMVGPGADPHHQIGPGKLVQVKRFWLAYFAACGANLESGRYGTTLQDCPSATGQ